MRVALEVLPHGIRDAAQLGGVVRPGQRAHRRDRSVGDRRYRRTGRDERLDQAHERGRRVQEAREHDLRWHGRVAGRDQLADVARQRRVVDETVLVEPLGVARRPVAPVTLVARQVGLVAARHAVPRGAKRPRAAGLTGRAVRRQQRRQRVVSIDDALPAALGRDARHAGALGDAVRDRRVVHRLEPARPRQDGRRLPPREAAPDAGALVALVQEAREALVDGEHGRAVGAGGERGVEGVDPDAFDDGQGWGGDRGGGHGETGPEWLGNGV